jgi:RNA polymerase sigma-70 factor (ECF subfamily)
VQERPADAAGANLARKNAKLPEQGIPERRTDPVTALNCQLEHGVGSLRKGEEVANEAIKAVRSALPSAILRTQEATRFVQSVAASALALPTEIPVADRSDEQLLADHLDGDTSAFPELVERYRNELLHFLIRFLGSRAAADDVFQDAFLQVHLSAESFDTKRRFKPWLYTIAANKGRDYHRRQKRRAAASLSAPIGGTDNETEFVDLIASEDASPDAPVSTREQAALVKKVVDELPSHYREILLLSYFQKMSYGQIADSLEIPLGTVKSRLHSAVASFSESWKAESSEADPNTPPA